MRPDEADRREALALVPVSRETEERLSVYVDLLRRWQTIKNLVGPSTLQHIWTRHMADSAQLAGLAPEARRWVDLGSGAGFPGLVVALVFADERDVQVDLIESNERKCAFLREVVRVTGAPARVHMGRIEAIFPHLQGPVDVVTSRALAPLPDLVKMSHSVLDSGAIGLFLTGDDASHDGGDGWATVSETFEVSTIPSRTRSTARIVRVKKLGQR